MKKRKRKGPLIFDRQGWRVPRDEFFRHVYPEGRLATEQKLWHELRRAFIPHLVASIYKSAPTIQGFLRLPENI